MNDVAIRDATFSDRESIVSLNADSVAVTSPMDLDRFDYLFEHCAICLVVEISGSVAGFLMGMHDESEYENENFAWFRQRLRNFFYVDRVVLAKEARGFGVGSQLYACVQAWSKERQLHSIAAEMDLEPPNVGSLKFHLAMGFVEFGTRKLESGKTVSMQVCPIDAVLRNGDSKP